MVVSSTILEYLNNTSGEVKPLSPRRQLTDTELETLRVKCGPLLKGMEFSVTFKPVLRVEHNSTTLTNMVTECLISVLKRHDFRVILIGEYSDRGMYHMHGLLLTNTGRTVDAIKRKLTRELGRIEIKQITWTDAYLKYMLKDTDNNRKIYNDEVIVINCSNMM